MRRARAVFGLVLDAARRQQYPFSRPDLVVPHVAENMPPDITARPTELALLLFYACSQMKGGINSTTAMVALTDLHRDHPEVFNPSYAASELEVATLTALLESYKLGFNSAQVAEHWIENSRRLLAFTGGDMQRFIDQLNTYHGACRLLLTRRVHGVELGFLGFGYKMVSMLVYFYMDAGLLRRYHFPPPIDIHWLRIAVATKIIRWTDGHLGHEMYIERKRHRTFYTPEIMRVLRRLMVRYTRLTETDPIEFANAIWLFARDMCPHNPGNWFTQYGRYRARNTKIERKIIWVQPDVNDLPLFTATPSVNGHGPLRMAWDARRHRAFARSCLQCVIHQHCRLNVPSMPYYRHGILITLGERQEPPNAAALRALLPR